MKRLPLSALTALIGIGLFAASPGRSRRRRRHRRAAPTRRSARSWRLPDFVPGLGTLYVDPATLPAGPFLAYDHQGKLVSSIYMIPLKDMNAQKSFPDLKAGHEAVDHVDIVYNAGHPGVAEPHYHMIVWYISAQNAAKLAK